MAWIRTHEGPRGKRHRVHYRDLNGVEHSETFARKADAERFARDVEADKDRGRFRDPKAGREPLAAFWDRWRERAERTGRPSARTLALYDEVWSAFIEPTIGSKRLANITRADVEAVVEAAAERSPWRAQDALKVLRATLSRAVAAEAIVTNPAARVETPRVPRGEPPVLTPAEIDRLADAVGVDYRALVHLGCYSGLRWSELVALRVEDLDLLRHQLRVERKITEHGGVLYEDIPKTEASRRVVALPKHVVHELAAHLERTGADRGDLVFTAPRGGPIRRHSFQRAVWVPACEAAGVDVRLGQLRHVAAGLAIAAGINPLELAWRLGHTSTRMVVQHYAGRFEAVDKDLAKTLGKMHEDREAISTRLRHPT